MMRELLQLGSGRFLVAAVVVATFAGASGAASSLVPTASADLIGCPADFLTDEPTGWVTMNGLDANAPSLGASQAVAPGTYRALDWRLAYSVAPARHIADNRPSPKGGSPQTTTYVHDALGNLVSVTLPGGTSISYRIDGRNRRVGKQVDGVPTQGFLYESDLRPVAELDGGNNVVSRFVYGTRVNVPDYMVKAGVTYRIVADQLGSPRLVVDVATGTVAQRIDYDEFGQVLADTNPGFQPFGFAGGLYDKDTKLVRFGARDYDAVSGRWTSKDPVGAAGPDPNLYAFVASDPVNYVDRDGKEPTSASQATSGGTAAAPSLDAASQTASASTASSCGGSKNARANSGSTSPQLHVPPQFGPDIGWRINRMPLRYFARSAPTPPSPVSDELSIQR